MSWDRGSPPLCEECGHRHYGYCSNCPSCENFEDDKYEELYDADELGLDPEDDDARKYPRSDA